MFYTAFRYSMRTNIASKLTIQKNMLLLYNKSLGFQKPYKFIILCQAVFNLRLIPAQWLKPFRNGNVLKNLLPKRVIYYMNIRNNLFILNISRKQTNSSRIIMICGQKNCLQRPFQNFFQIKIIFARRNFHLCVRQ